MPNQFFTNFSKYILFLSFITVLTSCGVGEEDPFLSFRSRDNRLKGNWKMTRLENRLEMKTFEPGVPAAITIIDAKFDGVDMRVQIYQNGLLLSDSTFGYSHQLRLKDNGESAYDYTVIYFGLAGLKSGGEDNWYWLNTDKKKARLYLGNALLFPTTLGLTNQLPPSVSFALSNLISDFGVEGLRKEELRLSFSKTSNQTTGSGGLQQVVINSNMIFDSK